MTKNDIKIVYMILLKQFVTFDSLIFYKNVITLQRKMNAYSQNNALFLIIDVFPSIHWTDMFALYKDALKLYNSTIT